mgnify:CR=1 FL=1
MLIFLICNLHEYYYNFKKLKEIISKEDLIKLTNHENQVLRLYAIRELIEQNDKSINLKVYL